MQKFHEHGGVHAALLIDIERLRDDLSQVLVDTVEAVVEPLVHDGLHHLEPFVEADVVVYAALDDKRLVEILEKDVALPVLADTVFLCDFVEILVDTPDDFDLGFRNLFGELHDLLEGRFHQLVAFLVCCGNVLFGHGAATVVEPVPVFVFLCHRVTSGCCSCFG